MNRSRKVGSSLRVALISEAREPSVTVVSVRLHRRSNRSYFEAVAPIPTPVRIDTRLQNPRVTVFTKSLRREFKGSGKSAGDAVGRAKPHRVGMGFYRRGVFVKMSPRNLRVVVLKAPEVSEHVRIGQPLAVRNDLAPAFPDTAYSQCSAAGLV
jgi:hypothetical protein